MNTFTLKTDQAEQAATVPAAKRYGKLDLRCMDNMELMAQFPDKHFELAIVDPPYGIGAYANGTMGGGVLAEKSTYAPTKWDDSAPPPKYFAELRRVSRNQIIWGANHFISQMIDSMKIDSPCWAIWDKENGENYFADCEMAWTSFPTAVRRFSFQWQGMLQGDMKNKEKRIHPTQKPVTLYKWLLTNYAKQGDKILDTHLGSGSIAIACHYMGFDLTGCELDTDYFAAMQERIKRETQQLTLL